MKALNLKLNQYNFFYNELVLKYLDINLNIKELDDNYDSYKTPLKYREEKISYDDNIEIYKDINNKLVNYINKNNTNYVNSYLIMLGIYIMICIQNLLYLQIMILINILNQ